MPVKCLGYLGVYSEKLSDWSDFSCRLLGMQQVERAASVLSFRMDDHKQRFVVEKKDGDTLAFMGWEVQQKSDLQDYATRLDNADVKVTLADNSLADRRCVEQMIFFADPAGNRIELFFNPQRDDAPFVPGRPHSGFRTGAFGLGHAVLHVADAPALLPFYRDLLDFRLSDYGLSPVPMYFFHVNARHHSFALIGSGQVGFHHFMVEFGSLDDVGQGYDIAAEGNNQIAYTLGRHTNDWMTSFYAHSPSGFFVESGWGGRVIDTETWQPHETTSGPSFWGHDRLYLDEPERMAYRNMRLSLASQGKQAPPLVDCPWLYSQLHNASR